ncbi:MAG TPA: FkbM family methyltransferase [Vicinamibacterales bacterium]|nr:FkbM family methyltransferase [Vicinamibacterales bacterium]
MDSVAPRRAPLAIRAAATIVRRLPFGRHRAALAISRSVREPFWAELPARFGSLAFRCDLRDGLMRDAYLTGRYEPQETAILQDLVKPGMTVVDVGANWGYFTLLAAHLTGPSGRIVCIEADPTAVDAIRANVAANRLATVQIVGVAASDAPRALHFARYEPDRASASGNYGIAETATADAGADAIVVAGRPLDDVLDEASVGHVDVLKMDIEGGEAAALRGLTRSFAARRIDRIILELHPAALTALGSSVDAVCDLLRDAGFLGWAIDHSLDSHRRAAAATVDVDALLSPLASTSRLGAWPHVLWRRAGVVR